MFDVFFCFSQFPKLCLRTGVVIDCIDTLTLPFLLSLIAIHIQIDLKYDLDTIKISK